MYTFICTTFIWTNISNADVIKTQINREYIDLVIKQAGQFLEESTCTCLCSKGRRMGCGNMSNAEDLKL